MKSIYWHDYETTGTDPARDRPLQFAGIRTDENLDIIGEPLSIYCKPPRDVLPHPMACLITGITPQLAEEKGLPEPQFIHRINTELSQPHTCGAGYNSLRFDDEVTRYSLYRNFYDPYEREWRNGNSRWDIIDMLRLTRALRPDGITWPDKEDGSPSFKLEDITIANGIAHEDAHDALSDVKATIALARLVKEKQPKLYLYVYEHRLKHQVAPLIDVYNRKPFLHVSGRLPRENGYTALMIPLCAHPFNKNAIIAFNLLDDPHALLTLDAAGIRERVFTRAENLKDGQSRIALKAIHINRCPIVATPKLLEADTARRLGIDLQRCEHHWQILKEVDLSTKLALAFTQQEPPAGRDADLALYGGFLPDVDKPLLAAVRNASPDELANSTFAFTDPRYRELLLRYKGRHFPDTLNEADFHEWEEIRFQMLNEPGQGRLTINEFFAELDGLEAAEPNDRDRAIVDALREWGDEIVLQD